MRLPEITDCIVDADSARMELQGDCRDDNANESNVKTWIHLARSVLKKQ